MASDEHIPMMSLRDGARIDVHPSCVANHEQLLYVRMDRPLRMVPPYSDIAELVAPERIAAYWQQHWRTAS